MKKITTLLILAFLALNIFANGNAKPIAEVKVATSKIEGLILDKNSGEALTGVSVYLDNKLVGYTDFDGKIEINNVTCGSHNITTKFVSYKNTEKVLIVKNDKSLSIKLENIQ